jgi:hypothetical protein
MVTSTRAASVRAVMSPNPTVVKTVTVKYSASVCVSGWVTLARASRSMTTYALANSSRNSGTITASALIACGPGNGDLRIDQTL